LDYPGVGKKNLSMQLAYRGGEKMRLNKLKKKEVEKEVEESKDVLKTRMSDDIVIQDTPVEEVSE
jgi:hypothetical protein